MSEDVKFIPMIHPSPKDGVFKQMVHPTALKNHEDKGWIVDAQAVKDEDYRIARERAEAYDREQEDKTNKEQAEKEANDKRNPNNRNR